MLGSDCPWRRRPDAAARRRYDPARPLLFTHVPKCAGTALRASLTDALAPRAPALGFDACLFGGFDQFAQLAPEQRAQIHLPGDDWPRAADFIVAHMAVSTTRRLWPTAQTMIVLREPVTRLLSLYLYWRAVPDEELARWRDWGACVALARRPLLEFLSDPRIACQTDNVATRMLLWPHRAVPRDGFLADPHAALLRAARRELARFDYADAIEPPDLHARLGHWLGQALPPRRENVSLGWAPVDLATELNPTVTARLLHLTRLDRRLWHSLAGLDAEALAVAARLGAVARYAGG